MRSPRRSSTGLAAVVDQHGLDLTAVPGVDHAGTIDHRDAVTHREPRARRHESDVPGGNGNRDAGRDHGPLSRRQYPVLAREQVRSGVAVVSRLGQWEARDPA